MTAFVSWPAFDPDPEELLVQAGDLCQDVMSQEEFEVWSSALGLVRLRWFVNRNFKARPDMLVEVWKEEASE